MYFICLSPATSHSSFGRCLCPLLCDHSLIFKLWVPTFSVPIVSLLQNMSYRACYWNSSRGLIRIWNSKNLIQYLSFGRKCISSSTCFILFPFINTQEVSIWTQLLWCFLYSPFSRDTERTSLKRGLKPYHLHFTTCKIVLNHFHC